MSLERKGKYRLELTPRFDKELHKLPKHVMNRIAVSVEDLKVCPYSFKRLHGELEGLYSMRVGDYRIIFTIDEDKGRVVLISAAHRTRVYEIIGTNINS
jgi:mRNA interferase RelE/StbE